MKVPGGQMDEIEDQESAVHLMLIADSKYGKTMYSVEPAERGFHCIYIDSDNGLSAIKHKLKNNIAAQQRILYIPTETPYTLLDQLLEKPTFRWNLTTDSVFSGVGALTDKVVEIEKRKIPPHVVLNIDSWSSVSLDAMELSAEKKSKTLEEMSNDSQAIYGIANTKLLVLGSTIQHLPFHVIVQAHGTLFERFERPLGSQSNVKQKDMILKETMRVPLSSSRPNGALMVKYFNQVGWIEMDRATGAMMLDFTRLYDRVGGGTPNRRASINEMEFTKIFNLTPPEGLGPVREAPWVKLMTVEEWKVANPKGIEGDKTKLLLSAVTAQAAGNTGPKPAVAIPAKPTVTLPTGLLRKS